MTLKRVVVQVDSRTECPDCRMVHQRTSLLEVKELGIIGDDVRVQLKCPVCDLKMAFISDEDGNDWEVKHGIHAERIAELRREAAVSRFKEAFRKNRALFRNDPDRFRFAKQLRGMQRRMNKWAEQELLRNAQPLMVLEKYTNG